MRYGGDEFLILLTDTKAAGAENVLKRINERLKDWNDAGQLEDFRVSLSIGTAEWHDGETLDEVLDRADRLMYEEKSL